MENLCLYIFILLRITWLHFHATKRIQWAKKYRYSPWEFIMAYIWWKKYSSFETPLCLRNFHYSIDWVKRMWTFSRNKSPIFTLCIRLLIQFYLKLIFSKSTLRKYHNLRKNRSQRLILNHQEKNKLEILLGNVCFLTNFIIQVLNFFYKLGNCDHTKSGFLLFIL